MKNFVFYSLFIVLSLLSGVASATENQSHQQLLTASMKGDVAEVKALIQQNRNVNTTDKFGSTPLHLASVFGRVEVVKLLIEHQANLELPNYYGNTPLLLAVDRGHFEVVNILIQAGANINCVNHNGYSSLHLAAIHGNTKMITTLLNAGIKKNLQDKNGFTSIHLSVFMGKTEAVRLLIQLGADVNIVNASGANPLLTAVTKGKPKVIQMLLDADADILATDHQGTTALFFNRMVRPRKHKKIGRLLKSRSEKLHYLEKERILLKRLGHAWNISREIRLKPIKSEYPSATMRLGGGNPSQFFKTMSRENGGNIARQFLFQTSKTFPQDLCELLQFGADYLENDASNLLKRIQSGKPTPLHIGFKGHAVEILFWGDRIALSNRGLGSRKPLEVFSYDPSKLSIGIIQVLMNLPHKEMADYERVIYKELPVALQTKKGVFEQFIETNCTLKVQTIDNCAWASSEGIVYAFFMLDSLRSFSSRSDLDVIVEKSGEVMLAQRFQQDAFEWWLWNKQMEILDQYLTFHLSGQSHYYPDEQLMREFYTILANSLSSDKSLGADIKERMDKITQLLKKQGFRHLRG